MPNQSSANVHPFTNTFPTPPWDAPDPLPVMRREMKLLLIELNVLRIEVEQLRAADQEARLGALMAQVPPWSLLWWRCLGAFKATDRIWHCARAGQI
jgi:hypothetical protein